MQIAFGEWLATRFEFEELMDIGKVQVAQPDVGRVGGIGEAKIVCDMAKASAAASSCRIAGRPASPSPAPRIWPSSPIIAPSSNICRRSSATSGCAASWRRRNWCCENGVIPLPKKPGLGVEVDWEAVRRYTVA